MTHQEVDALLAIIHELKRQGIATVFVSHRLDEVMTIAERVTVLRDGRNLGTYWVRDLDRSRLGELITGHVFESRLKAPFSSKVEPMLEVSGLTKWPHPVGRVVLFIRVRHWPCHSPERERHGLRR